MRKIVEISYADFASLTSGVPNLSDGGVANFNTPFGGETPNMMPDLSWMNSGERESFIEKITSAISESITDAGRNIQNGIMEGIQNVCGDAMSACKDFLLTHGIECVKVGAVVYLMLQCYKLILGQKSEEAFNKTIMAVAAVVVVIGVERMIG